MYTILLNYILTRSRSIYLWELVLVGKGQSSKTKCILIVKYFYLLEKNRKKLSVPKNAMMQLARNNYYHGNATSTYPLLYSERNRT